MRNSDSKSVQSMSGAAAAAPGDAGALRQVCDAVRLCNEIVFSLNTFGLSIFMAELSPEWMAVWKEWLEFSTAALQADADDESPQCALHAPLCRNALLKVAHSVHSLTTSARGLEAEAD